MPVSLNKRDIIHLIIGKDEDIGPRTKTGCGKLLEDCGSGVTYQYRKAITCVDCQAKARSIERLRGDASTTYPYRPELAIADRHLSAEQLQEKYSTEHDGGEHPQYLRRDWRHEVAEGDTLRGYWQWVESQIEQATD